MFLHEVSYSVDIGSVDEEHTVRCTSCKEMIPKGCDYRRYDGHQYAESYCSHCSNRRQSSGYELMCLGTDPTKLCYSWHLTKGI
jgi:hypothetical protein